MGVAVETLTRGKLNVRLESAGRPEVPNMGVPDDFVAGAGQDFGYKHPYLVGVIDQATRMSRAHPGRSRDHAVFADCAGPARNEPASVLRTVPGADQSRPRMSYEGGGESRIGACSESHASSGAVDSTGPQSASRE